MVAHFISPNQAMIIYPDSKCNGILKHSVHARIHWNMSTKTVKYLYANIYTYMFLHLEACYDTNVFMWWCVHVHNTPKEKEQICVYVRIGQPMTGDTLNHSKKTIIIGSNEPTLVQMNHCWSRTPVTYYH